MVTIQINEQYRIRSDTRQFFLEKMANSKDKNGEVIYNPLRSYGTIESAVRMSYRYFLMTSDADGIIELMAESDRIIGELTKAFTPQIKIN